MITIRPSNVFLKPDLAGMLRALAMTAQAAGDDGDFTRGYLAAVATVATALGIPPADVVDLVMAGEYTGRW